MPAPTISALPELPVFPSGPGLPDQPRPFFNKLLVFLTALDTTHRAELLALAEYLEGLADGGGGGSGGTVTIEGRVYMPLVNGTIPPVFAQNSDGSLIYVRVE